MSQHEPHPAKFALERVAWLIGDLKSHYGTLADHSRIKKYPVFPGFIADQDISIFKAAIENGTFKSDFAKIPKGYQVLSFVIAVKNHIETEMLKVSDRQNQEIIACCVAMWEHYIEKLNGDIKAAKKEVVRIWGKSPIGETYRYILNEAFKIATKNVR